MRLVRFRSGRHRDFWKGNVVAIGNAYGFVEPLESTGIHMIILEVLTLLDALPEPIDQEIALANNEIGRHWDYLRWFLGMHYKYNKRLSTKFWTDCRQLVDDSGIRDNLDLFRDAGPLSASDAKLPIPDMVFSKLGIDFLMTGQGEHTRLAPPALSAPVWAFCRRSLDTVTKHALPQREALDLLASDAGAALLEERQQTEALIKRLLARFE
jgi:tryptophan halogenase